MATLVSLRDLHKTYRRGPETIDVLHGINLDIEKGDFVALMGPSGSGKTTLLNLIGGLDSPTAGEIDVAGQRIDRMTGGQLAHWRSQNVGFVFQFYNLMPTLTAQKNVELPLLLTKLAGAQRHRNAGIALELVGLADRARHRPSELSVGSSSAWRSRARSSPIPTLLICDEPDGRSRPAVRRGNPGPAAAVEPRARQDDRDGDARSEGGRVRDAHAASRQGQARRTGAERRLSRRPTMKYLHLIWASLFRSKTRTLLTLLSVVTAFLLFGMLDSVRVAFNSSANVAGYDRLIATSKLSITQSLPYSLAAQIASVRVSRTSRTRSGSAASTRTRRTSSRTSPSARLLDLYPSTSCRRAAEGFNAERTGAIVGEALAKQFGWKLGDTIPLQATIFPTKGSNDWTFKLVGIFKLADRKRQGEERQ
jgi:putative ABC transport system ATP-binding protein